MTHVLVALAALALVAFTAAHLSMLGALLVRPPRYRAIVALVVPPLVAYFAWHAGMRKRAYVWGAAVTAYALGVALLKR